ncbi:MAG: hypothetical protein ACRCVT_10110 [Leadbetterella sp.]
MHRYYDDIYAEFGNLTEKVKERIAGEYGFKKFKYAYRLVENRKKAKSLLSNN